jgi:hypothetical protein
LTRGRDEGHASQQLQQLLFLHVCHQPGVPARVDRGLVVEERRWRRGWESTG